MATSGRLAFLRGYFRNRKAVGSWTPSSAGVSRAIAASVDAPSRRAVAELGAGTGPITAELLRELPTTARLWAFEIDPEFAAHLRQRFDDPRLTVVEGSAADAGEVARAAGIEGFDAVVSAIPFRLLGVEASRTLLSKVAAAMAPGAPFVALQFTTTFLPPLLRERFGGFERSIYPWNLPPAFIFRCVARSA